MVLGFSNGNEKKHRKKLLNASLSIYSFSAPNYQGNKLITFYVTPNLKVPIIVTKHGCSVHDSFQHCIWNFQYKFLEIQMHQKSSKCQYILQSNLAIRNFLVALKLFLNAKSSLSLWSKWQIGHRKWFLNTNLFHIKPFLIAKFDCTM